MLQKRQLVEGLTDLSRPLLVGPVAGLVVLPLLLPLLAFLNLDTMALGQRARFNIMCVHIERKRGWPKVKQEG